MSAADSPPAPRGGSWAAALLVAVPVVAHLPLLAKHAGVLWLRPHYQFFPVVLLGSAVLAAVRLRGVRGFAPGRGWVGGLGLLASWLVLAAGELLDSPWLGAVSALVLLPSLAYSVGGTALCRRLWPAWAMLWLAVPPPFELDRTLILWLQAVTTRWASHVLDVFKVYHATSGNVIEVDGRQLFVDQACSGVNSLFSLVACTLFLVFLTGRGPVRGGALLAAAFGWVLVVNVARVVGIVLLAVWSGVDVSGGWRHEAFGLVVFALAVGLLVSTDQFLAFLSGPRREPVAATPAPPATGRGVRWLAAVACPAFLALLGAHLSQSGAAGEGAAVSRPDVRESLLPPSCGGWARQEFHTHTREVGSYFGDFSHTWTYRRGDRSVLVSLDHPFPGWHDLTRCYTGQGWRVQEQAVASPPEQPGGYLEVRLEKPASRSGFLLVAQFDRTTRLLRARPGGAALAADRLGANVGRVRHRLGLTAAEVETDPPGPVYQFQVFAEGYSPLSAEEAGGVRELFGGLLSSLRAGWPVSPAR